MKVAGAVLAGGASRRMGTDKATLPIDGVPMAELVARALERGGCHDVVLVGGAARLDARTTVADLHPGEGPLGGVLTALRRAVAASPPATHVAIAPCDVPHLTADVVAALVAAAGEHDDVDVVLAHGDRPQPAVAVWSTGALDHLTEMFENGIRSLLDAQDALRTRLVRIEPDRLLNVNRPDEVPDSVPSRPGNDR